MRLAWLLSSTPLPRAQILAQGLHLILDGKTTNTLACAASHERHNPFASSRSLARIHLPCTSMVWLNDQQSERIQARKEAVARC